MSYYTNNSNCFSNNFYKKGCQEDVKKYRVEGTISCYPTGWYCDGYHEEQPEKNEWGKPSCGEENWQGEYNKKPCYCHKCKESMMGFEKEEFEQENFYPQQNFFEKQCKERGKKEDCYKPEYKPCNKQKNRCCFCGLFNCFK